MIVDIGLYRDGQRVPCASNDLATVKAAADQPDDFVWVGLHSPHASELMHVSSVFGLHPLAVEDALSAHQRPKLEKYDDSLFLVLKTLWYVDETDAVETGEINLFIGSNFVVSVRHGEGSALAEARRDLEARSSVLKHGPSAVVYAVTDRVVDAYERRMLTQVAGALPDYTGTRRHHIYRQALRLRATIKNPEAEWTGLSWRP